jgi:hypothetical protein
VIIMSGHSTPTWLELDRAAGMLAVVQAGFLGKHGQPSATLWAVTCCFLD